MEWHPGELVPRVGFIVTNLSRSAERVTWFYNQRGKAEIVLPWGLCRMLRVVIIRRVDVPALRLWGFGGGP